MNSIFDDVVGGSDNQEILKKVEMAVRAYDPRMSCATHRLAGGFPLTLDIIGAQGLLLETIVN